MSWAHELDDVLHEVVEEYMRAKSKHGEHTLDGSAITDITRLAALVEETGEVAELFTYDKNAHAAGETDWEKQLKKELIQVANVALTWARIL